MSLKAPNLDDRKFQDIVSEARSKIPLYCPRWTDYNLSDPGITLIELFAWMVDMLLYRLNRVPEKNYIKFMDLLGIRLEPPHPAQVDVTFRLSAAQPEAITIPRGTEVATVRTETQDAMTFNTNRDLTIIVPALAYSLTTPDGHDFSDCMPALKNPDLQVSIFQEPPVENNALYLGFSNNLSAHTLALTIESTVQGIGVDPRHPPLAWEYWDGELVHWSTLRMEQDSTGGLNTNGQVILHIPSSAEASEVNGQKALWLRCRATNPEPGQRAYGSSPLLRSLTPETIGGTVPASHAFHVTSEVLGHSDGTSSQKFTLHNIPVLTREEGEQLEVETESEGEFEPWQEVSDFSRSGPDDAHYTLDSVTGEIEFGPVIRQPSGEERQFGRIPPRERLIRFSTYRSGGGVVGNVGEGTITVLKSSIPYIASAINFRAASGGTDAETLDNAKLRVPRVLKARTRAVTAEDYEYLALEASPLVARAKCLAPGGNGQSPPPGVVRLLLVPQVRDSHQLISLEELEPPRSARERVQEYLDERRLLATRLEIAAPEYRLVAVVARVRARHGSDASRVAGDVENALYRYINPICGGREGQGLPFGHNLSLSEIYAVIQNVADVAYVEEVNLFPVEDGERQAATTMISLPENGLPCSDRHEIMVDE
jgi:predicted phage baseplate assembly protein